MKDETQISGDTTRTNSETEYSWSFAPLTKNQTYLGMDDPDFQGWLRSQNPTTRKKLEERYSQMELTNRGTHLAGYSNKRLSKRINDWEVCHAISCQAGLSNRQMKAVWHLFDKLDLRGFKGHEYGTSEACQKMDLVIFCLCILVHTDNQIDTGLTYYPGKSLQCQDKWDGRWRPVEGLQDRHECLAALAGKFGFLEGQIISCLETVRSKIRKSIGKQKKGELVAESLSGSDCWGEYINS